MKASTQIFSQKQGHQRIQHGYKKIMNPLQVATSDLLSD